jgi:hypothetical protein
MGTVQILKLSPFHEQLALAIIHNPGIRNYELAVMFGRTEAWLSTVRNSDCFRARLQELFDAAEDVVISDVPTKLRVMADMALDRVTENLEKNVSSPSYALGALKEALTALGYTQRVPAGAIPLAGTVAQQNNFFVADKNQLAAARKMLQEKHNAGQQLLPEAVVVPAGG